MSNAWKQLLSRDRSVMFEAVWSSPPFIKFFFFSKLIWLYGSDHSHHEYLCYNCQKWFVNEYCSINFFVFHQNHHRNGTEPNKNQKIKILTDCSAQFHTESQYGIREHIRAQHFSKVRIKMMKILFIWAFSS